MSVVVLRRTSEHSSSRHLNTMNMQPVKAFAGVPGGILSCSRQLLSGIALLSGSQIALEKLGDRLLWFSGGMMTLAFFWRRFDISAPTLALTEREKNEEQQLDGTPSTVSSALTEREKNEEPGQLDDTPSAAFSASPRLAANHTAHAVCILGTGSAFGHSYETETVLRAFHAQREKEGDTQYDRAFADKVFSRCGFDGHSICCEEEDIFRRFSREEYLAHRRKVLVQLAMAAAEKALAASGINLCEITHLFWGTMTGGMESPGIDVELTKKLGLDTDVRRIQLENSGCLTGFRLLNLGTEALQMNPDGCALVVCADARSLLQNSLPKNVTRSDIVSAALFRDAGSAVVLGGSKNRETQGTRSGKTTLYQVLAGKSRILPDTEWAVDYRELDCGGIKLNLSRDLPTCVAEATPAFVSSLFDMAKKTSGAKIPPISSFDVVCHTGGPKILKTIANSLGAEDEQLASSWEVMKARGNLSGASNMAVLDNLARKLQSKRPWALCLSMGPGICIEGVVMKRMEQ